MNIMNVMNYNELNIQPYMQRKLDIVLNKCILSEYTSKLYI